MAVSAMRHVLEDNKEGHDIEVMLIFLPDVDMPLYLLITLMLNNANELNVPGGRCQEELSSVQNCVEASPQISTRSAEYPGSRRAVICEFSQEIDISCCNFLCPVTFCVGCHFKQTTTKEPAHP
jgi:hypothetical protein